MLAWVIAGGLAAVIVCWLVFTSILRARVPPPSSSAPPPPSDAKGRIVGSVVAVGALVAFGMLYQRITTPGSPLVQEFESLPLYVWALGIVGIVAVYNIATASGYEVMTRVRQSGVWLAILFVVILVVRWLDGHLPTGNVSPGQPPPVTAAQDPGILPIYSGTAPTTYWTAWVKLPVQQLQFSLNGNVRYQCGYGAVPPTRAEDIQTSPCSNAAWLRFQSTTARSEEYRLSFVPLSANAPQYQEPECTKLHHCKLVYTPSGSQPIQVAIVHFDYPYNGGTRNAWAVCFEDSGGNSLAKSDQVTVGLYSDGAAIGFLSDLDGRVVNADHFFAAKRNQAFGDGWYWFVKNPDGGVVECD